MCIEAASTRSSRDQSRIIVRMQMRTASGTGTVRSAIAIRRRRRQRRAGLSGSIIMRSTSWAARRIGKPGSLVPGRVIAPLSRARRTSAGVILRLSRYEEMPAIIGSEMKYAQACRRTSGSSARRG